MRLIPIVALCLAASVALAGARYDEIYGKPDFAADLALLESKILALTLEERRKAGLGPRLTLNNVLSIAAQEHCDDMVARNYFDHKDPDGNNSLRRVFRHYPGFQGALGENIAAQKFAPGAGFDPDSFARIIVNAWLKSPGHRATLLSPLFRETGIGIAMSRDEIFVTQLFAGPIPGLAERPEGAKQR